MPHQPLAEVFGFPINNITEEAIRHRTRRLCPFNNKVPNCTKDKANNPLGVCSVFENKNAVITCPIRFRQDWLIASDAASFLFPSSCAWTSLTEVRLPDQAGRSAGNIDVVLVAYDNNGQVIDFGAIEIQAVYISGNIRNAFDYYMQDPKNRQNMTWEGAYYPRPDYLSSSRKRLAPQLIYKGGILNKWRKKAAVVVDTHFFSSLPELPTTNKENADLAWMIYDLLLDEASNRFNLTNIKTVYTEFSPALTAITTSEAGPIESFLNQLQQKLDEKLENGFPPETSTLVDFPNV